MTAPEQPGPGDQARATVLVAVPPAVAFRVFTEEIDQWWRRGLKYRVAGGNRGFIHLEPRPGGRLYESFETRGTTPSPSGTLVTVTHRGWASLRPDHPARHGQDVGPFIRTMGLWWGDQLTSLRLVAIQGGPSR